MDRVDIPTLLLRTVAIYFVIFLMMRIMGKREIGKLSVFDLVISFMIAEIAVFVIEDTNMPMIHGLLPMFTLVLIQVLLAYLTLKSQTVRSWFDGKPSFLIENGKLNREEMKKQRYTLDDLMVQLRENKVTNVADVEFAMLETSGKLSVIEKPKPMSGSKGKAGGPVQYRYEGLPVPVIMDGKVQDKNLEKLGKTRFWLKNQLQEKGVNDLKDVFFCTIDYKGRFYLDMKRRR
ncbi:DUF421 domain-containing protein [Paenibacillus koleovorans]|uniref:DUF421 domain-containing protein n=1 Tax=Paenibacillus koleovorans TaxID=121608 RepID=UPI000FDAECC1|nr:DUF421 domain-containing protein [Paenibacillus koleovorans]